MPDPFLIIFAIIILAGVAMLWKTSPCLKTLVGKHVLITGGSSGIGLAIAKEALSQGAFVTLIARSSAKLEKAVEELVDNKTISADRIYTKIADVGDYEILSNAIKQSFQWRPIDVLICNAGTAIVGYIDEVPIEDWHATINTNLSGIVNTLHVALRLMKQRSTGQGHARPPMSVVLVSSLAGLYLQYGNAVYTATKYGVKGLAEALRLELKPYNIGVSVVYPGYVETAMLDECGIERDKEMLKMIKAINLYNRGFAETADKVAKYTLEAAKNGTLLVTSQIHGLLLSTLSRGFIPADSVGRAFIELVKDHQRRQQKSMDQHFQPKHVVLTPFNYFEWKVEITLALHSKGLHRITMGMEVEPNNVVEKSKYFNRMDEAFGLICLSISRDLMFHVDTASSPNEV